MPTLFSPGYPGEPRAAAAPPTVTYKKRRAIEIKPSADGRLQGFYEPASGRSFLIADALTPETAPGVLVHEVGIHMAADAKGRAAFEPIAARASELLHEPGAFFERVRQRMDQAGETSGEEAAAYIAEEYERDRVNAPASVKQWIKELLAALRRWLLGKGLAAAKLDEADIAAIARANVRELAQQRPGGLPLDGGRTTGQVRYSTKEGAVTTKDDAFALPKISKSSAAWKSYQAALGQLREMAADDVAYVRSNSGRTARFERGGQVLGELLAAPPNRPGAVRQWVLGDVPSDKAQALQALERHEQDALARAAVELEAAKARRAAAAEKSRAKKQALDELAGDLREHAELIATAHHNRDLVFHPLPGGIEGESVLLHASPAYGKKPGSAYYLTRIEGRPAYVRVSDHWGRFESREADLSQFQPERDTMDASGWPSFWKSHDWQLDGAQPGERQAGYVLLDELPDAGRDGAVVRRSEKADDIEVGTKGLAKGMFRAPGGNWMDTREAALADAQRQNAARQTYQQEAQRRSDYNAHMGALAMANGELPTDALRRYGINGSQRLDRVSRVLQDVLGCWRRFKI
ncbi:MAG: hypothetical protein JSR68_16400, partial [Proteobacteria bacterium]|nr:hypothetical protein [Pseudomonadota bacterium]